MSRTDLDPATLAASLRRMAGDGSVEWVREPIQAAVLLDIADILDECEKLRELCADVWHLFTEHGAVHPCDLPMVDAVRERMCELGVEVDG